MNVAVKMSTGCWRDFSLAARVAAVLLGSHFLAKDLPVRLVTAMMALCSIIVVMAFIKLVVPIFLHLLVIQLLPVGVCE